MEQQHSLDRLDQLFDARELARLAFDFAPIGLVVTENRVLRECNQRFSDMFGYTRNELLDQLFAFLYPSEEEFQNLRTRGDKILGQGNPYWDERVMRRKNGELFWVRVRGHTFTPDTTPVSATDPARARSLFAARRGTDQQGNRPHPEPQLPHGRGASRSFAQKDGREQYR